MRLHFAELDADAWPGRREFDVLIDGEKVPEGFDIAGKTGDRLRAAVGEFVVDFSGSAVEIELRRSPDSSLDPIISGIEIMKK